MNQRPPSSEDIDKAKDAIRGWSIHYPMAAIALQLILQPQHRMVRVILLHKLSGEAR